jgi:hypothetical protein
VLTRISRNPRIKRFVAQEISLAGYNLNLPEINKIKWQGDSTDNLLAIRTSGLKIVDEAVRLTSEVIVKLVIGIESWLIFTANFTLTF